MDETSVKFAGRWAYLYRAVRSRRHREEVEGDDRLAVIMEKCQPPLPWVEAAQNPSQYRAALRFGGDEAEFLTFSVDFAGALSRVLLRQA